MHPGAPLGQGRSSERASTTRYPAPIAVLFDKRIKGITDAASRSKSARDGAANWGVWCDFYTVTRL